MKKQFAITLALMLFSLPVHAETIHVGVDGLVCAFCAKGVEKSLKQQPQTETVAVNLEEGMVTIGTKPNQTIKDDKIRQLITDAGFKVTHIHHAK